MYNIALCDYFIRINYIISTLYWQILNYFFTKMLKPRMILGFKNHDGARCPQTRLSNTVSIGTPQNLKLGDNVYIGHYTVLECSNHIEIGEGCQICTHVLMTTHSSHLAIRLYGKHYIEYNGQHQGYIKGSIAIGEYSFIGPFTTIMPNTKIGKGSIINAYSYVKGEFPDFAIIAGNPAQVIGDTRELDQKNLLAYPELEKFYTEWAQSN